MTTRPIKPSEWATDAAYSAMRIEKHRDYKPAFDLLTHALDTAAIALHAGAAVYGSTKMHQQAVQIDAILVQFKGA